jgi:hypothetical protein
MRLFHGWELLPEDVPYAFVAPPEKFVGSVGLVAELRLANGKIVDRQPLYLEWASSSPPGPAAAISSSSPPAPGPSSSPPVASDPNLKKSAAVPKSSSLAQDQLVREEAMVQRSFSRIVPRHFAIKQRKNAWTVGVAGGIIDGTYMRFADELGKVFDDGDNLRILPMVSYGAASNLDDLLYLRGVDIAVTQSDVFEYFRTERKTLNLQDRVHYLLRLPIAELHILAKTDIRSLQDLRGKK